MLAKDRPDPATYRHILNGHSIERDSVIRPKDRRGIQVRYRVELGPSRPMRFRAYAGRSCGSELFAGSL